jgi:hypothetical protein
MNAAAPIMRGEALSLHKYPGTGRETVVLFNQDQKLDQVAFVCHGQSGMPEKIVVQQLEWPSRQLVRAD